MNKTLKIVLLNKTVLSNGVVGPEYTPMTMSVEEIIQNLKVIKPTPRIAYATNIAKEISLEVLEAMLGKEPELETADQAAAKLELAKEAAKLAENPTPVNESTENSEPVNEGTAPEENPTLVDEAPAEVNTEKLEDGTPVITGNQQQGNKKRR